MEKLAGSRCGVFVGSFNRDYKDELQRDPEAMPLYHVTGTEQSMLANRISYVFDFRGPSISLDTACSASMTALHLACQSINSGECQEAIVGGSSLMLNPNVMITMSALRYKFPHLGNSMVLTGQGSSQPTPGHTHLTVEHAGMPVVRVLHAYCLNL